MKTSPRQSNRVSRLATEIYTFESQATGKTYEISVALPYAYVQDTRAGGPFYKTLDAWSTVYLTDANWHMNMVTDFVREAAWCGRSYDALVIGIGYPEADSPQETWRTVSVARSDDLTPERIESEERSLTEWINRPVKAGGAENFMRFLQDELIPWVERTYRSDPTRRILVGHSYGGLLALYAMFREPGLFYSYVAASPYLRDPGRSVFAQERAYAQAHRDLPVQLYLGSGELEESDEDTTVSDMHRLEELLASRGYPGLKLKTQVWADNNHCEAAAPAIHAGLKFALRK